jgi:hypothetical protein
MMLVLALRAAAVQAGCIVQVSQKSIHLREKNIAHPTERSQNVCILLARGKDVRFSMKMMLFCRSID